MSDNLIEAFLLKIDGKLDQLIEVMAGHEGRLQTLEADYVIRRDRKRGAWKIVGSVMALVVGTALLTAMGMHR